MYLSAFRVCDAGMRLGLLTCLARLCAGTGTVGEFEPVLAEIARNVAEEQALLDFRVGR